MDVTPVVREMTAQDWTKLAGLNARAFVDEPYAVGMFGTDRAERFAGLLWLNDPWPPPSETRVGSVAELSGVLVGFAVARLSGHCRVCTELDPDDRMPDDPIRAIDRAFDLACREAHLRSGVGPHARVGPVSTEPLLFGRGLGARLMSALMERLWQEGSAFVLLECVPARVAFYERLGFRKIDEFPDPMAAGLVACVMLATTPR